MHNINIISGIYKGKKLIIGKNVRPTIGRVRKAVFDILYSTDCVFQNCLDCFAGTGAMGTEALSNGFKFATFVEKDKEIFNIIKNNLNSIEKEKYEIINNDILNIKPAVVYDLIIIDPPFDKKIDNILAFIIENNFCNNSGCYIVIERPKDEENINIPDRCVLIKNRTFGTINIKILKYISCDI